MVLNLFLVLFAVLTLTQFVLFFIFVVMASSREPDRDTGVKGMPNA